MKTNRSIVLGGALMVLFLGGCDKYGEIVELGGEQPQNPDGTLHVTWGINRVPAYEAVKCEKIAGEFVLVTVELEKRRTYRIPCELGTKGAWIPVKSKGEAQVRAELVGVRERKLSRTRESLVHVASATERLELPFVSGVN